MYKNLSLMKKLIGSFSVILVLLVVIGGVGYKSLERSDEGLSQYRELARNTNLAGRVQANMLMARMEVKNFIINGREKDIEEFDASFEKTEGFMAEAHTAFQQPERARLIKAADESLKQYKQDFEQVKAYMHQRDILVNETLSVVGTAIVRKSTEMLQVAQQERKHVKLPTMWPSCCGICFWPASTSSSSWTTMNNPMLTE